MYLALPIRKLIKVIFTRHISTKRERVPLTFQDCLDSTPKHRCDLWKYWWILFLTVPLCYYMFHNIASAEERKHMTKLTESDFEYMTEKRLFINAVVETTKKVAIKKQKLTTRVIRSKATTTTKERNHDNLPICEIISSEKHSVTLNENVNERPSSEFQMVKMGGCHRPRHCHSRHKVGILVPFRDREQHLSMFLFNIHPFLIRQNLEYRIFVIEQFGNDEFNKGRLFNAGFKEMTKFGEWKCVIFHDVDLLPLDERILYTCPIHPRHMSSSIAEKESIAGYRALFGGVSSMTVDQYKMVNGYSNLYWGWGGEDADMFWRLKATGLSIVRYRKSIARYAGLPHAARPPNPRRRRGSVPNMSAFCLAMHSLLNSAVDRYEVDGLSNVNYNVVSVRLRHLYTHLIVDVNPLRENITKLGQ